MNFGDRRPGWFQSLADDEQVRALAFYRLRMDGMPSLGPLALPDIGRLLNGEPEEAGEMPQPPPARVTPSGPVTPPPPLPSMISIGKVPGFKPPSKR